MKNEKSGGGKGYIGKIPNKNVMIINAPFQQTDRKSGKVKRGKDLRTGK